MMIKSVEAARGSNGSSGAVAIESVAGILERELQNMIRDWLARVDQESDLIRSPSQ
jgi:hypothetical protein